MQKEEQLSLFPVGRKYWWLNDESLAVLNRGYLLHGETVQDAVKRITVRASEVLKKPELQPIFEEMIANGWLSLSSPVWANMGTNRGINIACFGSYVTDEIEGITDKLSEVIMQTKIGGGTSGYFGELRGRGASITNNGKSSGAVSFMELFNTAMNVVSQGCFLPDDYIATKDKDKGIRYRFIEDVVKNKLDVIQAKIVNNDLYYEETKPLDYIEYNYNDSLFEFTGNYFNVKVTKEHNMILFDNNKDKTVITAQHLYENKDKYQDYFMIYFMNDKQPTNIYVKDLDITTKHYKGKVYCVEVESNMLIYMSNSENLVFPVLVGNSTRRGSFAAYLDIDHPDIEEFLQIKDVGHPIQNLFYGVCVPDYWLHEMINGDSKKRDLWAKVLESRQQKGLPYIFFTDNVNKGKPEIYKYLDMKIHNSNLCVAGDTKLFIKKTSYNFPYIGTIKNVIDSFEKGEEIFVLSYNQKNKEKEHNKVIKVFRQGIKTTKQYCIYLSGTTKDGETFRYEHTSNSFRCTPDHKILCIKGGETFYAEAQEIVKNNYCVLSPEIHNNPILQPYAEIVQKVGLIDLGNEKQEEVFDITVENEHNFIIVNNRHDIILSNCSEIALPTSKDESFVCCLAAMNLELYDEWKDTKAVQYAIWFLDAVLSDFIENTKDQKHLQTARNFAIRHRAIGLGTLALHSYYQKIGRPFGHPLNIGLNNAIFSHIRSEAEKASRDLAREYGVAPIFNEVGPDFPESEKKRNTTLMTIMPTTSSSAILGQVSPGIEPYSSNYYKVDLAKGNFIRKNKYLRKLLKSKGKDNDEVWSDIMIHQGSVQHLDFLTQDEKDIFKTFKEISQYDIIQQAAARQKYIDQSQSLNLNIPPSIPVKEVNKLILEAWKLGVKTLYYQRSQSVAKDLLTNLVTCSGCES